jgi:hypothetical protein
MALRNREHWNDAVEGAVAPGHDVLPLRMGSGSWFATDLAAS